MLSREENPANIELQDFLYKSFIKVVSQVYQYSKIELPSMAGV